MNVIGHRGASVAEGENTVPAFVAADAMSADGVELDVRLAPDGAGGTRLVVFHDRLPTDQAAIDALPGFDEILDACGERMLINVEIKNSHDDGGFDPSMAVVEPTIEAMDRHGAADAPERWLISSFSAETVERCREVAPHIATALLCEEASAEAITRSKQAGHRAIHPWAPTLTHEVVRRCHDAGLLVNTWTCNDPARLVELEAMGVDGVCTDVPDVARRALGRTDRAVNPRW